MQRFTLLCTSLLLGALLFFSCEQDSDNIFKVSTEALTQEILSDELFTESKVAYRNWRVGVVMDALRFADESDSGKTIAGEMLSATTVNAKERFDEAVVNLNNKYSGRMSALSTDELHRLESAKAAAYFSAEPSEEEIISQLSNSEPKEGAEKYLDPCTAELIVNYYSCPSSCSTQECFDEAIACRDGAVANYFECRRGVIVPDGSSTNG